jgi:hypothetical protein
MLQNMVSNVLSFGFSKYIVGVKNKLKARIELL